MSADRYPTRNARIASETIGEPVEKRKTYTADIAGNKVVVHHATTVFVGTEADDVGVPTMVSVAIGFLECGCDRDGCEGHGTAFEFLPSTEHARMLAGQLIEAADEVDAAAKRRADDLIARARRS